MVVYVHTGMHIMHLHTLYGYVQRYVETVLNCAIQIRLIVILLPLLLLLVVLLLIMMMAVATTTVTTDDDDDDHTNDNYHQNHYTYYCYHFSSSSSLSLFDASMFSSPRSSSVRRLPPHPCP